MKAIIFDCDGTLVDSEMSHYTAWSYALSKHNVSFSIEEYSHCVGHPSDITSQMLTKKIGKDCANELKKDKHIFYQSLIEKGVSPIEDTFNFLMRLIDEQKKFGYKLGIASGAPSEHINLYLRDLKIEHYFDVVLSGKDDLDHYKDPEGVNKPKPYIYQEAAKRLGVNPTDCIAIEDSQAGVMASSRAGYVTIAIPTSFSYHQDFSAAHLVLSSFKDYSVSQFLTEARKHKR